jgi:hypothetical protein
MNKDEKMRKKGESHGNSAGTTWSALDEIMISPFVSKVKPLAMTYLRDAAFGCGKFEHYCSDRFNFNLLRSELFAWCRTGD